MEHYIDKSTDFVYTIVMNCHGQLLTNCFRSRKSWSEKKFIRESLWELIALWHIRFIFCLSLYDWSRFWSHLVIFY